MDADRPSMRVSPGAAAGAPPPPPPALRIGAQGLSAGEAGLLRALVTLIAHGRGHFPWTYAEHGADATVAREPGSGRLVLALGGAPRARLASPLTARELEECLDRIATGERLPLPPAADAAPATPAAGAGSRLRLRRWPPPELLRGDKQRVRLATFLSRQWFTVEELAAAAQAPVERCRVFVQLLQGFELLATAPVAPRAQPLAPAPRAAPGRWSLVRSIRRRLGLGEDA